MIYDMMICTKGYGSSLTWITFRSVDQFNRNGKEIEIEKQFFWCELLLLSHISPPAC